ncbi:MAG TPA: PQQ-binding-like beta-propeller repeat protein [bacterium]|nr:PQQ-binding-like beta-propeller repeat protein [bacterium]HQL63670.1 PQQ-binding-like beta-propeller repeat protein [bacterium]
MNFHRFFLMKPVGMFFAFLAVCLWFSAITADDACGENWPTYRHDSAQHAVTSQGIKPPLSFAWEYRTPHAPKPAWYEPAEELPRMRFDSAYQVTVADGIAYFGSSVDNKVYALDAETGEIRWTRFTDGPVRLAPSISNGNVYVGSDDGYVYCLSAQNGEIVWKFRAGPSNRKVLGNGRMISLWPVRTNVLVDDGIAYFAAGVFPYEGIQIYALNAETGEVIWKNDTIGDRAHELNFGGISPQGYLVVSKEVLYVPSSRAMPAGFSRRNGEFLFYLNPGGKVGGTWVLLDRNELIAGVDLSGTPAKVSYEDGTGQRLGEPYAWFPGVDLVVTPENSFVLTPEGVYAIDRVKYPEINKRLQELASEEANIRRRIADLRAKLAQADQATKDSVNEEIAQISSRMKAIQQEQGQLKSAACRWFAPAKNFNVMALAGQTLILGGKESLIALDITNGKEVWKGSVSGEVAGLAVSDGKLLVSSNDGSVSCFTEGAPKNPGKRTAKIEETPYKGDRLSKDYQSFAKDVFTQSSVRKGYCLVLGCGDGHLAYEIARQSEMFVIAIDSDPQNVQNAKAKLDGAALYGTKIIVENWDIRDLPDYFANLIVYDSTVTSGEAELNAREISRVLRPDGGAIFFRSPIAQESKMQEFQDSSASIGDISMMIAEKGAGICTLCGKRKPLEKAGSWRELYGNSQNTACSDDQLVECPLGVLWFGEPGPSGMVERHARSMAPVSIDGRLFIQGEEEISAYDAYNGTFLWKREIPGAVRVRVDVDGGNLVVTDDALYVAAHDKCHRLDPETGETVHIYPLPIPADSGRKRWGYISSDGKILFGSVADPLEADYASTWDNLTDGEKWKETPQTPETQKDSRYTEYLDTFKQRYPEPNRDAWQDLHRAGALWHQMNTYPAWGSQKSPKAALTDRIMLSECFFALDAKTGDVLWTFKEGKFANIVPVIADGKVFLAHQNVTGEQKALALNERKRLIDEKKYEESEETALLPGEADIRMVVSLDAKTGKKLWEKPVDLTGCGGDRLASAYQNGVLLFFGTFSNHDGGSFQEGALRWRRITALSASVGDVRWSRPLNYLRRPLLVGNKVIIEPRACNLETGEIETRTHPISGEKVPWEFLRPGHCCSITSAAPSGLFYRSYNAAFYDMNNDAGISFFGAIRPGCWINLIPANGLLLFPEASSGCTCSFPLKCSMAFKPRENHTPKDWTVFVAHGPETPVKELAINLGAPGDMRDDDGTLWFGYPRFATKYTSHGGESPYGVQFKLNEKFLNGMGYFAEDFRTDRFQGIDKPWLFASGCLGALRFDVPLIDDTWGEEPGRYTILLGFIPMVSDRIGQRVFDIRVQGKVVAENFDPAKETAGQQKTIIKELPGVSVSNALTVELIPKVENPTKEQAPLLNFVKAVREDVPKSASEALPDFAKEKQPAEWITLADAALEQGDRDRALVFYHAAASTAWPKSVLVSALQKMAQIKSPQSLSIIKPYCGDLSPVLWNYREPDSDIVEQALRVYVAVADDIGKSDPAKAIGMLNRARVISPTRSLTQDILSKLDNFGFEVGKDAAEKGYVTRWLLAGPFPFGGEYPLDKAFVGEPAVDVSLSYDTDEGTRHWERFVGDAPIVDLVGICGGGEWVSAYAYAEVPLENDQDLYVKVGSNDGFRCWWNGEVAGEYDGERGCEPDQDALPVHGKKGINTILMKITQTGGLWCFSARITDRDGNPIRYHPIRAGK